VSAAWPAAVALARRAASPVVTYAVDPRHAAELQAKDIRHGPDGVRFQLVERGHPVGDIHLAVPGLHNVENALGAWAAVSPLGVSLTAFAEGCRSFRGVRRRQEVRGEVNGVLVVDDFAHHPTAVRETIRALRSRWPDRRLWAVFEPRSNTSRRRLHQTAYSEAFDGAARVSLKTPEKHDQVPDGEELDIARLVSDLRTRGLESDTASDVPTLVARVVAEVRPGDVILGMSNGSFGGFHAAVLAGLREKRT
jgi:UDP-N-acetylmuramate: L-alanyl-gamma-D-glutamyl-meso-diaminopimelate ligase